MKNPAVMIRDALVVLLNDVFRAERFFRATCGAGV
jgi:hypothetical protein